MPWWMISKNCWRKPRMERSLVGLPPEALAIVALHSGRLCLYVCKRVLTLREHIVNLALNQDWQFIRYVGGNRSLVMKAMPFCMLLRFLQRPKSWWPSLRRGAQAFR